MEKNLEKNPFCSAMAGIKTLHYADIKNVSDMTPTADGWNVTLSSGHYWSRIYFAEAKAETKSEGSVNTSQRRSGSTRYHGSGTWPISGEDNRQQRNPLADGRHNSTHEGDGDRHQRRKP